MVQKKQFNFIHFFFSAIVLFCVFILVWVIIVNLDHIYLSDTTFLLPFLLLSLSLIPLHLLLYFVMGVYSLNNQQSSISSALNICKANLWAILIYTFAFFVFNRSHYFVIFPRAYLYFFFFLNTPLEIVIQNLVNKNTGDVST